MTCSGTRQLKQMFFANFKFSRHFYNKLSVRNVSTHTTPFHTLCFVFIYTPSSFRIASCWFPWGGSGFQGFFSLSHIGWDRERPCRRRGTGGRSRRPPGGRAGSPSGARPGRGRRPLEGCRGQREECVRTRRKKKLWVQGLI